MVFCECRSSIMRRLFTYFVLFVVSCCGLCRADDIVVFTASWCAPCGKLKKMLKTAPEELKSFGVRIIDIDEHPDAAKTYSVTRLPTTIRFYADGTMARKVGYTTEKDFFAWLKKHD
jgi:thioredoxin-like negative regulator of GroEL